MIFFFHNLEKRSRFIFKGFIGRVVPVVGFVSETTTQVVIFFLNSS